jgi:methionyl-tRNA synthetase
LSRAGRPRIVIAATPTPNGDLHVGHLAGPYLAADIFARALRAQGQDVTFTTVTDDHQTYVTTTADRLGVSPEQLCATSTAAIQRSLEVCGITLTSPGPGLLPPVDDRYQAAVTSFVTSLRASGRLRSRAVRLPWAERSGRYLYDGLVTGRCPDCGSGSAGGVCEDCGHPNIFDQLLDPQFTLDPSEPVTLREVGILVLPMEEYRAELVEHFASTGDSLRPRARELIRRLLARPLPEIPVTVPGDWGVSAPFPDMPGQIVYPWVEAMPASMYATWWANGAQAELPYDHYWRAERGAELVFFHGFDNVYHWAVMDLVLLLAHGDRYVRPAASVCNEFYELDHVKFSTSRGHLISAADLAGSCPRDIARFHLALTAPETERTNFDPAELADGRLSVPWNALSAVLDTLLVARDLELPVPVTEAGRATAAKRAAALGDCFASGSFSPARAAGLILEWIHALQDPGPGDTGLGDLLLGVRTLLAGSAPLLVDIAVQAAAQGIDLSPRQGRAEKVLPFRLPRLPESQFFTPRSRAVPEPDDDERRVR